VPDPLVDLAARLDADVRDGRITSDAAERELGRQAFELLLRDRHAEHSAVGETGPRDPRLAAVLRHLSDLEDEDGWKPAPGYDSVALALIDAIWSMGVRYQGVLNVIARYTAARIEGGGDAKVDAPEDLLAFIDGCGSPDAFAEAVKNRQRTSSRSGILKAEAVQKAAAVLASHDVSTPEQLRGLDADALAATEADWCGIEGQGSGLSWEYFQMLCGISGVKADRHIRRFVAEALDVREAQVSAADARALVIAASDELGTDWRVADYAIWNEMSNR
jgi:hypothetical protein